MSFIGFVTQELSVGNQTIMDVQMRPDITQLSEVVVVGFGETERRKLTGAVSSINSDDFKNFNAQSVDQLLQGRSAGVAVSSTGGFLGSPITVRVRGVSSIQSSSQPLYIVDGVPVKLTSHEFRVLCYLMHQGGRVVSRSELTEHIYAQDFDRDSNTVEVFIARLRRKLGSNFIETVRGLGYRMKEPTRETTS